MEIIIVMVALATIQLFYWIWLGCLAVSSGIWIYARLRSGVMTYETFRELAYPAVFVLFFALYAVSEILNNTFQQ